MGFDIGIGGAFLAGMASFLTPCILPIVPFYLCYMAGVTIASLVRENNGAVPEGRAVRCFVLGRRQGQSCRPRYASVFGQHLREYFDILRYGAAIVIAAMGLHFLGWVKIPLLYRQARMDVAAPAGMIGPYLVGLAFAFGWTPCVGPVLAMILFSAGAAETVRHGAFLLLGYGVGMTLPFILAAFFFRPFMKWMKAARNYGAVVEKGIGGALLMFAALIGTNTVGVIAQWMLDTFPVFGTLDERQDEETGGERTDMTCGFLLRALLLIIPRHWPRSVRTISQETSFTVSLQGCGRVH